MEYVSFSSQTLAQLFSDETIKKIKKEIPNLSFLKLFSFGNALIRPCGASVRASAIEGRVKKTGIKDIDDLLAPELGNCIVQETFMKFVMQFCGYSLNDADKLRKGIAKKKGTEQFIEDIHDKFIQISKPKYGLSDEKCEEIIQPILQCIMDASRYAFSWNHSDAYSFIGYACGWLRHYYPLEFVATCLNVWDDNEEKTAMIKEYATKKGIKIYRPKFRHSRAKYYMDSVGGNIYKGMKSIKYLNDSAPEELYALRGNEYKTFTDLLVDIKSKTSINSRQLEILMKLDFFSEFGNGKELFRIYDTFCLFNEGKSKQMAISNIKNDVVSQIIERHSRKTTKTYMDMDTMAILYEIEEMFKSFGIEDFTLRDKIEAQKEYLGYIDFCSNQQEDRTKLIILDIKDLVSKKNGKVWAKSLETMSMGSGKRSNLTVYSKVFDKSPLMEYDIIRVNPSNLRREEWNGFINWYLDSYNIMS